MARKDKRVDLYIGKAQPFAKPILNHLRKLVHKICPDAEETIKWRFPHFLYRGEILCSMASFQHHCAFGFWKAPLMTDTILMKNARSESAMGHLGRITSLNDLPSDKKIVAYIKEAVRLNDDGIRIRKTPRPKEKKKLIIPSYFFSAIKKNATAYGQFKSFSYSNQKKYVEWVTEAKTNATRTKRIETSIEWMTDGKIRNWKYVKNKQKHR